MPGFDAIVVGGGIIGAASAYYLAKKDLSVLLLERDQPPSPRASSADHARVFRLAFGKDVFYTQMAIKTLPLWKELQGELREELLLQTGMLDLAAGSGRYEETCYATLKEAGLPVRRLTLQELGEQYRMLRRAGLKFAVFHPDGGLVWAQRAIRLLSAGVAKLGSRVEGGAEVTRVLRERGQVVGVRDGRGRVWKAANYVFAAGPWTRDLLEGYGLPLRFTRQESLYFRPPRNQGRYRPTHLPVFSFPSKGVYGFPVHIHGFMKLDLQKPGAPCRNAAAELEPDFKFEKRCRGVLKDLLPDLCGFTDQEGRASLYTWTSDGDFLLDRLPGQPNAWVAAGFGGNGPQFAPLVGRTVAELVTGAKPDLNLHRFRIDRLRLRPK